jgi:hypothetical protein
LATGLVTVFFVAIAKMIFCEYSRLIFHHSPLCCWHRVRCW